MEPPAAAKVTLPGAGAPSPAEPPRAAERPGPLAYIPIDRRTALAQGGTLPDRARGAALFADVSGFTPLAQAFAHELGATRGAEALLEVINPVFAALIGPLHHWGGSVVTFVGDAITCWFDDSRGPAAPRAVATALAMQEAMAHFATVRTPAGTPVALSIKVAIAAGTARRLLVGDPLFLVIDVLAGATLERMALAESLAGRGQVIAGQEVAQSLGRALVVAERRAGPAGQRFVVVQGLAEEVPPVPWPDLPDHALSPAQARPWLPAAIHEQFGSGAAALGDLRPVVPLFVKFTGIDYDADDAGEKMDAFVRWAQRIVHRRGGTLLQLALDAKGTYLYATFGAPVAHEDDPARAMHAALALRALPPELGYVGALQMGLTRGEVWTGTCGGAGRFCYGVIGADVNLAARLMAAAQPGQVLVTGRLRAQPGAASDFDLAYLGDRRYKGLSEPIPTFELRGEQLAGQRIFPNALVGREAELERLLVFARALSAGRPAGVAAIYGEAGIGKSHLAYALRQALGEQVSWFTGQCDQVLRLAFNPFVYWLRHYFEQTPSAPEAENLADFEARFDQLLERLAEDRADPTRTALAAQLVRVKSVLGALVGLHWPGSLYEQLDAKGRHENILAAIPLLLQAESRLRPVVLELEDGNWLDEVSLEALTALSRHLAGYPLLILITARYADDGSRPALALDPGVPALTLDLEALAPDGLARLAEDLLGGPADPGLLALLQDRSQGNPFFAQQVVDYMLENHQVARGPHGAWQVQAAALALPSTITAILVARIDRLAHQVKEIVQAAAVVGREFHVRVLSQMLRADVQPLVLRAEQEQIWTALHELRYLFRHSMMRDAVYAMQLRARLRQLHGLAASAYEALYADDLEEHYATLAYHYGQAEEAAAERRYALLAGEQAAERFAHSEALRFFRRALELTPQDDRAGRYALLLARERILSLQGDRPAQQAELAALEELAGAAGGGEAEGTAWRAEVAYRRSRYAEAVGDYPRAIELAQEAIALAQSAADAGVEAVAQRSWGVVLWQQGDNLPARERLQQALQLAREIGQRNLQADCLCALGCTDWSLGDYAAAQRSYEESLQLSQEVGDRGREIISLQNLGLVLATRGDWSSARDYYEHSLAIAREIGYRRGENYALEALGTVLMEQGDYAAAREVYAQTLAISREIGDRREEARSYTYLGEICRALGDYAGAREQYTRSLELARAVGERASEGVTLGNLSLIAHNQGDQAAAREYGEQALQLVRESGDRRTQGYALTALGHALAGQADWAGSLAAYQEALAIRRELGESCLVMETLAGLARVYRARGDAAAALEPAREVAAYLEAGGTVDGADEPLRIYLACWHALADNSDPRGAGILATAYRLLQERAAQLADEGSRRSFLEQVPYHREVVEAVRGGERKNIVMFTDTELRMDQSLASQITPLCTHLLGTYDLPGLAIGVVQDGRVAYVGGFGVRSVVTREPVTPRSLFHMASVSKLFVTTAVMQLWERGLVELDAPVVRYLPYFALTDERHTSITVAQMLSHTSGMPDVKDYAWDQPEYDAGAAERYVRSLRDRQMIGDPGARFAYSNMAFEVLGDLIAKVSGKPFEDYVQENVLDPAGMADSTFLRAQVSPALATAPHLRTPLLAVSDIYPYHRAHAPSSTLHSSALEMCTWGLIHLNRGTLNGRPLLAPATYDLLWSPRAQILWDDGSSGGEIGLGWFLGEHRGLRTVSHGGGDVGYSSYFTMAPEKGLAVVVLTNVLPAPVEALGTAALDILLGREPQLPRPPLLVPLGRVLAEQGPAAAAAYYRQFQQQLEEAYDVAPNYWAASAAMLLETKRYAAALPLLELSKELYPERVWPWRMMGEIYLKRGERKRALETLQEAQRRKPDLKEVAELLAAASRLPEGYSWE